MQKFKFKGKGRKVSVKADQQKTNGKMTRINQNIVTAGSLHLGRW